MSSPKPNSHHPLRSFVIVGIMLLALIFVVTFVCLGPMASRDIIIYAGPQGTAYYDYGTQYVAFLRDKGLTAQLVETAGSLDNLERLAFEDRAAVCFAQSGIERLADDRGRLTELVGLASVAFEPFWVFVRQDDNIESLKDLSGKRVATGPPGSGSRAVTVLLFEDNGIEQGVEVDSLENITLEEAVLELTGGGIDAVCAVGEPSFDDVEFLLKKHTLALLSLPRAAAYARRHPDLGELVLPAGALDVARDVPRTDLNLVAPTTVLVGNGELRPAAVGILLEAAKEIHRPASLFAPQETFPNTRNVSLPLSSVAVHYFERGPNVLHRFLPFRVATVLGWLVALLTPLATAAIFLFKVVPWLIRTPFELRLLGFYRRLEHIEKASRRINAETLLDELERESAELKVPRSLEATFFEFRQNLYDLRDRVSPTSRR